MLLYEPAGLKYEEKRLDRHNPIHFHTHEYLEGMTIRVHYHSSLEVNVIQGVKGFIQVEGRSIPLESFSVVILPPGSLHSYRILGEGGAIHVWHMGLNCFQYLEKDSLLGLIEKIPHPMILPSADEAFLGSLWSLNQGTLIEKNAVFLNFVNQILESLSLASFEPSRDEFLHRIIQFLEANFRKRVSLEQVAEHAHLSRFHFCRKFKERSGSTYLEYLNNLRLEHSLASLNKGESVEVSSQRAGFEEASYYIRRFKDLYGITPGVYQKLLRQKQAHR